MSAYDNPTIIKDDSAMIYAQMLGTLGQTFTESFNAARKEREAKEKEKRLEDEKKAKADKEQSITDQKLISDFEYKEQVNIQRGAEGLQKIGATPDALTSRNNFLVDINKVVGKNNLEISRNVLSKEDLDKKNKYASDVLAVEANLDRGMGAAFSQSSEFIDGKITRGNIGNIVFNGNDLLSQGVGKAVFLAFTYPKASNATKGLDYDVNNPADARLDVKIPLNNLDELKGVFKAANATASDDEVNEAIEQGKSNKSIIVEGKPGEEKYTIKYNPKLSEWTGEFYTKIPEIGIGDTSTTVGIYSKEGSNDITNDYLEPTQLADLEGNLLLPGSAGTAKYQRTEVKEAAVKESMRPALRAKAAGLINTYFSNNNSGNGILRKLGFGTDYPLKKFNKDYEGDAAQVEALTEKMVEEEWKNIRIKSDLKEIDGKYYVTDAESYQMFNKPSKKGSGGATGTQKNQEAFNERIRKVIKNKAGGVSKGGYTLQVLDGRWGVYDKDGIPKIGTEDITDPSVLATFIGGTID